MGIPDEKLRGIEKHFHELLLELARDFDSAVPPVLPTLTGNELGPARGQFVRIGGMFGGCDYGFVIDDTGSYLKVVATSRMDHNFRHVWHVSETGYQKL